MRTGTIIATCIFLLTGAGQSWGNCIPGHTGLELQLTQSQIDKFCSDYEQLKPSDDEKKEEYKETYDQYCKKTSSAAKHSPVITRVSVKDNCLAPGDEVRITGRDFGKKGSVHLSQPGEKVNLAVRSWSDREVRVAIRKDVAPGRSYRLWVETADGKSSPMKVAACREKVSPPAASAPGTVEGRADLVVKLTAPDRAVAGEALPGIVVEAANEGDAAAGGYAIALLLTRNRQGGARATGLKAGASDALLETIPATMALSSKGKKKHSLKSVIPADTKEGQYYLCARIDPENRVGESKENNNIACSRITVKGAEGDGPVAVRMGSRIGEAVGRQGTGAAVSDMIIPVFVNPPANLQFLSTVFGLMINGEYLARVREGQPAVLQWNLPPGTGADGIWLLADWGAGFPADSCESVEDFGLPVADRGYHPGTSGVIHLDTGPPLMVGIGAQYQYMGCLWNSESGYTGDTTNLAQLYLLEDAVHQAVIERLYNESLDPDLVVSNMTLLRGGGTTRGKIAFTVSDRHDKRQEGPVSYQVYVNDALVEQSTLNLGPILFGWGGLAMTEYAVPDVEGFDGVDVAEGWKVVKIAVNGDGNYAETDYGNNSRTETMTLRTHWPHGGPVGSMMVNKIIDVWKEDEGDRWLKVGMRYMKSDQFNSNLTISIPGVDCKTAAEEDSLQLQTRADGIAYFLCEPEPLGPVPVDFTTGEVESLITTHVLPHGYYGPRVPEDWPPEMRQTWPLRKNWTVRYTVDRNPLLLPRLTAEITHMKVPDSYEGIDLAGEGCDLYHRQELFGRNGEFEIVIRNEGPGPAPPSTASWLVKDAGRRNEPPCQAGTGYSHNIPVPALEPGGSFLLRGTIPENLILHPHWPYGGRYGGPVQFRASVLGVKVDRYDSIFEMPDPVGQRDELQLPAPGGSWGTPAYTGGRPLRGYNFGDRP